MCHGTEEAVVMDVNSTKKKEAKRVIAQRCRNIANRLSKKICNCKILVIF